MIVKEENKTEYVEKTTDQDIFEGKTLYEQNRIAKEYILKHFRDNGLMINNHKVIVNNKTATKYTNPREKITPKYKEIKNKISTELDNLLLISKKEYTKHDKKSHSFAKDGWEYYKTTFKINNDFFKGIINIGKNGNNHTLYDITNIKRTTWIGKVE